MSKRKSYALTFQLKLVREIENSSIHKIKKVQNIEEDFEELGETESEN